jgi:hypothetical protein
MVFGVHAWAQKAVPTLRAISVSVYGAQPRLLRAFLQLIQ